MASPDTAAVRIAPAKGLALPEVRDLWKWRELLFFLAWRDIRVRYNQAALGIFWAVLRPMALMVVFTLFFGIIFQTPSEGIPRAVFIFAGVITWLLFAEVFSSASNSLLKDRHIFEKLYFPRLIIPLSSAASPIVDFAFGLATLVIMMAIYGVPLNASMPLVLIFATLAILLALSVGIWFSALNLQFTDFRHITPLVILVWFYASAIFYPVSLIPERWQPLFRMNPMVSIVEGVRWVLFGSAAPYPMAMLISLLPFIALAVAGLAYFVYFESTFAENL